MWGEDGNDVRLSKLSDCGSVGALVSVTSVTGIVAKRRVPLRRSHSLSQLNLSDALYSQVAGVRHWSYPECEYRGCEACEQL
jgi:hypothetical protein